MKNYQSHEPCAACGQMGEGRVCYHHIKTRGAGGSDERFNLMPLCFKHHEEIHKKGTTHMAGKYLSVMRWLNKNEWYFCEIAKKFKREETNGCRQGYI